MTPFWWSATAITLACFAAAATAASVLIALAAPALARRFARYPPAWRAAFFFRLRVLPAASAAVCALGIALPVFLWFEPRETEETFARTLMLAAVAGGGLLVRGVWRAAAGWRATALVRREWQARGRRLQIFDTSIPVFAVDGPFPTVAVVGFSRPVLFIAERVLGACTADEVGAMLRHECAHITHRDNLKRFLIRASPDLLRRGSALDQAWVSAAEEAADARVVARDPGSALPLAQALIRVARLAPRVNSLEVASAFYLDGSIEARVRRLVEPADNLPHPGRPLGGAMAVTMAGLFAGVVVLAAPAIHQLMEAAVRFLP